MRLTFSKLFIFVAGIALGFFAFTYNAEAYNVIDNPHYVEDGSIQSANVLNSGWYKFTDPSIMSGYLKQVKASFWQWDNSRYNSCGTQKFRLKATFSPFDNWQDPSNASALYYEYSTDNSLPLFTTTSRGGTGLTNWGSDKDRYYLFSSTNQLKFLRELRLEATTLVSTCGEVNASSQKLSLSYSKNNQVAIGYMGDTPSGNDWANFQVTNDTGMYFNSPVDNSSGSDFYNWSVAFSGTFPSGNYRVAVGYGVESTSEYADYSDYQYFFDGLRYDSVPIEKTNDLEPGDYLAKSCLVDTNIQTVFCTDEIQFTVISGGKSQYFNGTLKADYSNVCGVTAFAIPSFEFVGVITPRVDFGQGLCKLVTYLFVPDEDVLKSYSDFKDDLLSKAPFTFVTQVKNVIDNVSAGNIDMPEIELNLGIGNGDMSTVILSDETIEKYTTPALLTAFRTLMVGILWWSFVLLLIAEWRVLFKKN